VVHYYGKGILGVYVTSCATKSVSLMAKVDMNIRIIRMSVPREGEYMCSRC
jgi:hypothetical protein